MTTFDAEREPIAAVTERMTVVDSTGANIGKVALVRMGDPDAITVEGQRQGTIGLAEMVAKSVVGDEPHVPEEAAERLVRLGYIKVDSKGFLSPDRYAAADDIADVTDDIVTLRVPVDQLIAKG